jgi:hypothetical protein
LISRAPGRLGSRHPVVDRLQQTSAPPLAQHPWCYIAAAPNGQVYAAFPDYDTATGRFTLRLLASPDQGRTWTTKTLAASTGVVYLQPMVAVTDNGRVGVSVFAVTQNQVDVLLFTAGQQATGFRERLVTSRPFDATLAIPAGGQYYLGDHQGLTSSREAFHPFWNDTRTGRLELFTATGFAVQERALNRAAGGAARALSKVAPARRRSVGRRSRR